MAASSRTAAGRSAALRALAAAAIAPLLLLGARAAAQDEANTTVGPEKRPGPIPYSELVGRSHPAATHKPKPAHKPIGTKPQGPAAQGGTIPGAAILGAAIPGASIPGAAIGGAPAAAPPVPTTAAARAKPGPPPPPDLPLAAPNALAPAQAGARLAPGQAAPPAEVEAFVSGFVRAAMAADHVPGAAVAVVQNGQVVLERGYGLAKLSPAQPVDPRRTVFRLGSISKTFTWIEVLRAVEAGRMRLSDPVDAYLPPQLKLPTEGFRQPVRLEQLMAHTAGFESREFGRLFVDDPARIRPLEIELGKARPRRVREPGEVSSYSNYGAALAGEAVAAVDKRPFDDLVEADLLRPAGLASTSFREPYPADEALPAPMTDALADRLADGFGWSGGAVVRRGFAFGQGMAPAVSASSSADDMARFMLILLADGRLPNGASLWGPRVDAALRTPLSSGGGLLQWTHGLMIYDLPGGFRGLGHDGALPGFRARFVTVPQLGLGVFVATNSDAGARLAERLGPAMVAHFYAAPSAPPAADAPIEASAYAGLYLSTRRAYHGLEDFVDRLTRLSHVSLGPDGRLTVSARHHAAQFVPTSQDGQFVSTDGAERIAFTRGHDGRAVAYALPGGEGAERVDLLHRPQTLLAVALLAAASALLALAGPLVRVGRTELRRTSAQLTAEVVQLATALVWLGAIVAFLVFLGHAADPARLMFRWPDGWLVGASAAALVATLLTLTQVLQLGGAWAEGRRQPGWSAGRKLRHTATVLWFLVFAVVLFAWGALEPWAS